MNPPEEFHVIAVSEVTNEFLVRRGWKVGMTVRCSVGEWIQLPTFRPGFEAFSTKECAEGHIEVRKGHFSGVKFGVASYKMTGWDAP